MAFGFNKINTNNIDRFTNINNLQNKPTTNINKPQIDLTNSVFNAARPQNMAPGGLARSMDVNTQQLMAQLSDNIQPKVDATISDSWEEFKEFKPVKDGVSNILSVPSSFGSDNNPTVTGGEMGFTVYSQEGFENSDLKITLTYLTPPSREVAVGTLFDATKGDQLTPDSYGAASLFTSIKDSNLDTIKSLVREGGGFFVLKVEGSQPPDAKVAMLGMELFGATQTYDRNIASGLSINSNSPADKFNVSILQYRLVELGFLNKSDIQGVDPITNQTYNYVGSFGPKTEAALKEFQTQAGIEPTGTTTAKTVQALSIVGLKEGDKGELVGTLQQFLRTHSNISSTVIDRAKDENGVPIFTREMEQAIKAIQRRFDPFTQVNGEVTPFVYRVLFNPGLPLPGSGTFHSTV